MLDRPNIVMMQPEIDGPCQWRWSAENLEHSADPEDEWRAQTYFPA